MANCAVLYESIEHADDTVVRFVNKNFFGKLKVIGGEFNGCFIINK